VQGYGGAARSWPAAARGRAEATAQGCCTLAEIRSPRRDPLCRPAEIRSPRRAPSAPPSSGVPSLLRRSLHAALLVTGAGAVQDSPSAPVRGPTRRFALREQATHICLLIRPERKLGATFASFVGGCFANPNALCGTHFAFASPDGYSVGDSLSFTTYKTITKRKMEANRQFPDG